MAVLSKHVCEFVDGVRAQQPTVAKSVEAFLRTKLPAHEIPVTRAEHLCARCEDTEKVTNFQAPGASKNDSDIIIVRVSIYPPVLVPGKHI